MAAIYWMNHKGNLDCEVVVQRTIQADRRDAAGSVSDHHNKATNSKMSHVILLAHIKVTFTLYCSVLKCVIV